MKILRLDLLAFGPFAGKSLVLERGHHGLHVVYGSNEAGKSSSLRALRQWLYGIPHNTNDNFFHSHQNLRIGGALESAEGQQLECVRRKGRTNTLRGPDDAETVDPACLSDMLGGVDEAMFVQKFGIDYPELRRGGEAVARGAGDLGEVLFAAGAGIADVHQVQSQIESEMRQLFKPGGSKPSINSALRKLKAARDETRQRVVPTSEWVKHEKALRAAEQRQTDIDEQLRDRRATKSKLERIDKALPLIGRRKGLNEQFVGVADARLLPDDFSRNRLKAITEIASTRQIEVDACRMMEKLRADIAKTDVPHRLLEDRAAITRLHTDLGSYRKAAKDRPGLVARLENAEKRAREILLGLSCGLELQHAEKLRISRAQRQRIQSLAGDCKARLDQQRFADQAVHRLRDDVQRVEREKASLPAARGSEELTRSIRRAQKHGDLDRQLSQSRAKLDELETQAEVDLKKLQLWCGTLEELEQLPVPALETIDRFENELADAKSQYKTIAEIVNEMTQRAHQLGRSLEKLCREQDVPTEEDLTQARQWRDTAWQLVRRTWREGWSGDDRAADEFVGKYAPGGDLAQAFQASIDAADAIADRLRREADRVAEKARLTIDRQDVQCRLEEQKQSLASAAEALRQVQAQWRDQWKAVKIDLLSPREMRSWLTQQRSLAHTAEAIRKQRSAVEEVEAHMQSLQQDVYDRLESLGEPVPKECDTLARKLEHCENVVDAIKSENQRRHECETNLRKLCDDLSAAVRDAQIAKSELDQWRIDWERAVARLGLGRDASPNDANSVIESVDELFGVVKESDELRSRIDGIDRDADEFHQSVRAVLAQVAEDLVERPVDQAVAAVYDRLEAGGTAQTKLNSWNAHLESEEVKRNQARAKIAQLEATIEAMCQQAGCTSADDLPVAEERSGRRRDIERELKTVNEQLNHLAAGAPLDEWIVEAQKFNPDTLRADLPRLEEEISELDRRKTEVAEAIGSHRNEFGRIDGSARAAVVHEDAEHFLAGIRSDAEQYVRLRLASAVLRRSIDRFREASQGPVLARAAELFSELTLGSFSGLRAEYDDKDSAVLVGVRADGRQTVGVDGMSAGTCDQLYLSLRLAFLESTLADREPLPFIVDDILIMFDDDRAVAALKALSHLSEKTQVIFFTHHQHLVRLARENLDDDVLFTHKLCGRQEPALHAGSTVRSM